MGAENSRKIDRIEIRCEHCGNWFRSAIHFGNDLSFLSSTLIDNKQNCSHRGKMTDCNKENMRWVSSDGKTGFLGNATAR
jgi:hypothetical protein